MKRNSLEYDLSAAIWHKSTYSGGSGGDCLEVADGLADIVPVRDSKSPELPGVVFPAPAWSAFVASLKSGSPLC
ncbi:DUF397 domain-containing protein [Streptomyces sp. NPDC051217]|uniref:DUF397 domain-containing protein n=1 Tax=Streptomyces sp. NPDC051217 TaxID=3365644 RepID=UPI0037AFC8FB